ncbi:MAG TPA: OmpH family outer membrane protein [Syntrophales bacterium]|nr:OmpH family outer membrane protein [Syntrophales bacterium]
MKRNVLLMSTVFAVLSIFLTGTYAIAAEKIGVIDMREIMMKSDAGKKATEEFGKFVEKDRAKIQAMEAELKRDKDEIEKQRSVLKESALREKETAHQKKFRDYQLMVKDANEELQMRDQELSKRLIPDILKVVQAIGEKEKYTLVIDVGSIPVAYFAKESNMTEKVIEEFNKSFKAKK